MCKDGATTTTYHDTDITKVVVVAIEMAKEHQPKTTWRSFPGDEYEIYLCESCRMLQGIFHKTTTTSDIIQNG